MAMNKNGMRNTSFRQEASKSKGYNLQAAINYCKLKGIKFEDLSPEELEKFAIK